MLSKIGNSFLLMFALGIVTFANGQQVSDVEFTLNPSGKTPLAGRVTFKTDLPTVPSLLIVDAEEIRFEATPNPEPATEHDLMVLGLLPGRTQGVSIRTDFEIGNRIRVQRHNITVTTDPLPEGFPPIELKVSRPRRMEPGYTMIPLFRWKGAGPDEEYGLVVVVDERGEVVWYYETDHAVADLVRLRNGNYAYQINRSGLMAEIDMLGNTIREWHTTGVPKEVSDSSIPVATDTFHHDFNVMPSSDDATYQASFLGHLPLDSHNETSS